MTNHEDFNFFLTKIKKFISLPTKTFPQKYTYFILLNFISNLIETLKLNEENIIIHEKQHII